VTHEGRSKTHPTQLKKALLNSGTQPSPLQHVTTNSLFACRKNSGNERGKSKDLWTSSRHQESYDDESPNCLLPFGSKALDGLYVIFVFWEMTVEVDYLVVSCECTNLNGSSICI
jgi:hypothetical protein